MPSRLSYLSLGVQQAQIGDLTTTGNLTIGTGKTLNVGSTTVFDSSGKIDWSLMKNTPYLYNPASTPTLPTTSDVGLGDVTFTWASDVSQVQGMSGTTGAGAQSDGYLLFNTRQATDLALQPRLKVDQQITTYGNIVPNANNTLDLGQSTNGFRNAYIRGSVITPSPVYGTYVCPAQTIVNNTTNLVLTAGSGNIPVNASSYITFPYSGIYTFTYEFIITSGSGIYEIIVQTDGQASQRPINLYTGSSATALANTGANCRITGSATMVVAANDTFLVRMGPIGSVSLQGYINSASLTGLTIAMIQRTA